MRDGFGRNYFITSVPAVMAFDERGPRLGTKITDPAKMSDEKFLEGWIREEARSVDGGGTTKGWFQW